MPNANQMKGGIRRCKSIGGGGLFRCEMDENHIGKCKVFSKDGLNTVLADWHNDEEKDGE